MKDWEKAEQRLTSLLVGGWRTPGSGNQHIRGDVRNKYWVWEVKQTSRSSFELKHEWFSELKDIGKKEGKEVGFALFFELRPYYYVMESEVTTEVIPWKSLSVTESTLPADLQAAGSHWSLVDQDDLVDNYL